MKRGLVGKDHPSGPYCGTCFQSSISPSKVVSQLSFCTLSFSSTGFYHSDMLSDDSVTAQISCSLQGWI